MTAVLTIDDLLPRLRKCRQTGPEEWQACCPAHDDQNPSLSIALGQDSTLLLKCHAGCEFEEIITALNGATAVTGKTALNGSGHQQKQVIAIYDYQDETGQLLFQKLRYEPKDFRIRRPSAHGWEWGLGDIVPVLYHLLDLIQTRDMEEIFIVEGEKDADRLSSMGLVATCNFDGASKDGQKPKWRTEYNRYFSKRMVYVIPDNDEPGHAHAVAIAHSLYGIAASIKIIELPGLTLHQDVSDWLDLGYAVEDLRQVMQTIDYWQPSPYTAVSENCPEVTFSTFEDVDKFTGSIEWMWPGWLAKGYLHILASESGVGKSYIAMRIAGCFLAGMAWPDGQPFTGETGKILWCEAEAAQQLNKERALSLGLPLDKIVIPNADPFRDVDLRNIQDKDAIRAAAFDDQIQGIFIDSLSGADPREENSSDKLSVLKWVAELGRDSGKPILVTHHLNKPLFGDEAVTLNRLRGSTSITQMTRIVWALDTPDLNDKENKRLFILKNNLAKFPKPLGVKIDQDVQFGPAPSGPQKYSELDRAMDFLQDLLARRPLMSVDIEEAAQETDISKSTLSRAKKALGIKSIKQVDGWYWSLPILDEGEKGK